MNFANPSAARASTRLATIAVALALALGGCVVSRPSPQQLSAIKSIGLVEAIDHRLNRQTVALLVFGNEHTSADLTAWHLDQMVDDAVRQDLTGRYTVVDIPADVGALHKPISPGERFIGDIKQQYKDRVAAALPASRQPTDAILLVMSQTAEGVGGTNQSAPGFTIFSHVGRAVAMVTLDCVLLDGKTLEPIGYARAVGPDGPVTEALPADLTHDRIEDYTPAEMERLHVVFTRLTEQAIANGLKSLALSPN